MSSELLGIIPSNLSPPSPSIRFDRRWGYPAATTSVRSPPPPPLSTFASVPSQPPSYFIPAFPNVSPTTFPGLPTPSSWSTAPAPHSHSTYPHSPMSGNHIVYNLMTPWPHTGPLPAPGGGGSGGSGDKKKKDADGDDKKDGGGGGGGGGVGKGGGGGAKKAITLMNCLFGGPNLHIQYDLRDTPDRAALFIHGQGQLLDRNLKDQSITSEPCPSIQIISPSFPWCIKLYNPSGITLGDLLERLHEKLWELIQESEYWAVTDEKRYEINKAYQNNCKAATISGSGIPGYGGVTGAILSRERSGKGEPLRRVDWLTHRTILVGLERDETFIAQRISDKTKHAETWVLSLRSNSS